MTSHHNSIFHLSNFPIHSNLQLLSFFNPRYVRNHNYNRTENHMTLFHSYLLNLRRLETKLFNFFKWSEVVHRYLSLPRERKEISPGLDNALCRETRFRCTTSSVKPIIGGYHSSLVYINVACDRSSRISEIIGDMRTFEWLARLIPITVKLQYLEIFNFFFFFFRYFYWCAERCVIRGKIFMFDFFESTCSFEPREKYCDSQYQRNFGTLKILSAETL